MPASNTPQGSPLQLSECRAELGLKNGEVVLKKDNSQSFENGPMEVMAYAALTRGCERDETQTSIRLGVLLTQPAWFSTAGVLS